MISIVICSARPDRLAALKNNVAATIGMEHEIIAIDNSDGRYGICKAYNEGGSQAKYPYICFMHEDISFDTPGWGQLVIQHLSEKNTGLIGIAGGDAKSAIPTSWSSPMVSNEINIFQHFRQEPARHIVVTGIPAPKRRVVALDGVWLCTRKEVFSQYKFDEATFPGFHGYDIDYSLQVQQQYELYVIFDIVIHHYSEGHPDRKWMDSAVRVSKKWKQSLPVSVYNAEFSEYYRHHWQSMRIFLDHLFRLRYNYFTILRSWITWSFTRYFSWRRFGSMGKHIYMGMRRRLPLLIWLILIGLGHACKKTRAGDIKAFITASATQGVRYKDDVFSRVDTGSFVNVLYRIVNNYDTLNHLALDVYQPADDTLLRRPAVVLFHGGGFTHRDPAVSGDSLTRKDPVLRTVCMALAKKGYVVISPSYRRGLNYSPLDSKSDSVTKFAEAAFRATQDARAAIRFVRKNAAAGHIDTSLIFVGGGSAGAMAALNVAYLDPSEVPSYFTSKWGPLDGSGMYDYPGYPTRVKGLLNIEGVIADTGYMAPGNTPLLSMYGDKDPFYWGSVNAGSPPFTFCNGKKINARATHLSIPSQLVVYPGGTHGSVYDSTHLPNTILTMANWLYQEIP